MLIIGPGTARSFSSRAGPRRRLLRSGSGGLDLYAGRYARATPRERDAYDSINEQIVQTRGPMLALQAEGLDRPSPGREGGFATPPPEGGHPNPSSSCSRSPTGLLVMLIAHIPFVPLNAGLAEEHPRFTSVPVPLPCPQSTPRPRRVRPWRRSPPQPRALPMLKSYASGCS